MLIVAFHSQNLEAGGRIQQLLVQTGNLMVEVAVAAMVLSNRQDEAVESACQHDGPKEQEAGGWLVGEDELM
jgi:hypothetical protein